MIIKIGGSVECGCERKERGPMSDMLRMGLACAGMVHVTITIAFPI